MKSTAILIPARYNSSRFPGKPLAIMDGEPLIVRTVKQCLKTGLPVYVLTDDYRIESAVSSYTTVYLDETRKPDNGTERCANAIQTHMFDKYDKFVNVQGDMPDITPEIVFSVIKCLEDYSVSTANTHMPAKYRDDPNTVKLVRSNRECLWFGRGMVGYGEWHLGVYGYSRSALEAYPRLGFSIEEEVEKLEQLRWLKNGYKIGCAYVEFKGVEINTPEDIEKWYEVRKSLGNH